VQVEDLSALGAGATLDADLVIVGGGPAGLTIAREFFGSRTRVLIVESGGLAEEPRFEALNAVESVGEPGGDAQVRKRIAFHGENSPSWSQEVQPFGVRCRVLGGSSQAWFGKSAAFDRIDFEKRPWVANSGWPFARETLDPFLARAADVLNLGPVDPDHILDLMGPAPDPQFDKGLLKAFFWQFARSRLDNMDMMRFGPEFLTLSAPNVRVLTNATVTRIETSADGARFEGLEVATVDGARARVTARTCILAASGIENPRLLLASNQTVPPGLGNAHDVVGRYLMDHPGARLGRFEARDCDAVLRRLGFFGARHGGRAHMYVQGLAASDETQRREEMVNTAIYVMEERAPDDPWDALKRLMRARSGEPIADLMAVASSPGLLAKGIGMRVFDSAAFPERLRSLVIDAMIRHRPNFVVREFQNRGLPHKLTGLMIDGIAEQAPDPESRITLSDRIDPLGVPIARVDWRIPEQSRRSMVQLMDLVGREFARIGLPAPTLEPWVAEKRLDEAVIIDMAHTLGTTRMSDDPRAGVVDAQCKVHGVEGLYVAGGSVFPTSGHANPTLMILAMAIRLADHLKAQPARV
jgi:choline dehydrogenase-like flavoprotein